MDAHGFQTYASAAASCAAAGVCWLGVAVAANRLASRWLADAPLAVRCSGAAVVATAFIVVLLELLGSFGVLARWSAAACALAFLVVSARAGRRFSGTRDLADACAWLRSRLRDGCAALFWIIGVVGCQALFRALRCPPLSWDSLTHHALFPALWIRDGALASLNAPGCLDGYRAFPPNGELLTTWFALPFGGDIFMGLVNFPVMLWLAVSLYALARELGVRPTLALAAPVCYCFSPRMWGLVTTQYSDPLLTASMISGVLFTARYLRTDRNAQLAFAAAAFGLAAGTKYTALPPVAIILALLAGRALMRGHRRTIKLRALAAAVALASVVGGYRYGRNWYEFGNPVYPIGVSLAGADVFVASVEMREVSAASPGGSRADDWSHFLAMASAMPDRWGPKVVVVLLLAIVGVASLRTGRARPARPPPHVRIAVVLCGVLLLLGFAAFYLPNAGMTAHVRRGWPEASARMLAVPIALATCLAVFALRRLRLPRGPLTLVLALSVAADWWAAHAPQPLFSVKLAVVSATVFGALCVLESHNVWNALGRAIARRATVLTALTCAVFFAAFLLPRVDAWRQSARYVHYSTDPELSAVARRQATAWQSCDAGGEAGVIALVGRRRGDAGDPYSHNSLNWFFYPLLGSRWQNHVTHVPVPEAGDVYVQESVRPNSMADPGARWLARLARARVDRLVVLRGAQPEEAWIAAHHDLFEELHSSAACRVLAVRPERLAAVLAADAALASTDE